MNIAQIENNLQKLISSFSKENFIYDLLLAYGLPKASITRLQKGNLNLSKVEGEISWKKKVFFKEELTQDLHVTISVLAKDIKYDQRFVIVTDYKTFLAIDTKTQDKLDIELKDLPKHYDFFLPWAGMEKAHHQNENPADVKAAERMAKLFDEIKKDNPDDSPEFIHGLNVFLCRLLFCFFAEDTNIFEKGQFTNAIASHTQAEGSDLNTYLDKLFEVLNTPEKDRQNLPAYLNAFPYVNGGLFGKRLLTPTFTRRSRQAIIDNGELDWSVINPDIFGSMMQAVIKPEHRGGLGIHYTSVPNIMKVIEPLFLNDLKEAFEKAKGNKKKLEELLRRLRTIKIFDPACGSGNFLIIVYKELRRLEMQIFKENKSALPMSAISLEQFYGIELDDFAHEITQLSLWLAEHQMNVEFFKKFGRTNPTLPLKESGNIVQGNACRLDWETVCPKKEGDEIYILGNPPYLGSSLQDKNQKSDMALVFNSEGINKFKALDYISSWFLKGSSYIKDSNSFMAFVTTDSICQGQQVELLWPHIAEENIELGFAHSSFKWGNNAKSNAGVSVVIVGLRNKSLNSKFLFRNNTKQIVSNINFYLRPGRDIIVSKRSKSLAKLTPMTYGNKAVYGEPLILSESEYETLIDKHPSASNYIKKLIGAKEFLDGDSRWCIWVDEMTFEKAKEIPLINDRFEKVRELRLGSTDDGARGLALRPYQFRDTRTTKTTSIVIPLTTSEKRDYIPIGFSKPSEILTNAVSVIYDEEPFYFGILSSKMHLIWTRAVSGTLESRIRYSSAICYNTFPLPPISDQRKQEITQCVFRILEEREKHPEKTLAQLYDPDKMPKGLREAHHLNDLAIERCYRSNPFVSDDERLDYLFKLYEKMIAEEQEK